MYPVNWLRNNTSTSVRAGPGQFVTDIEYMVEKKHFLIYKPYQKNHYFSRYFVARKSHMTVERGSRLELAPRRSQLFTRKQAFCVSNLGNKKHPGTLPSFFHDVNLNGIYCTISIKRMCILYSFFNYTKSAKKILFIWGKCYRKL